jgi:Ni2+-binding GTPase involved in maturation of urease and hydrogenase
MQSYSIGLLDELESDAIYLLREAAGQFERAAWEPGAGAAGSTLERLAQKAFAPAPVPFVSPAHAPRHDALITPAEAAQAAGLWGTLIAHTDRDTPARVTPLAGWSRADFDKYLEREARPPGSREAEHRDLVRLVVAGSRGAGKSSLLAKLLERGQEVSRRRFLAWDLPAQAQDEAALALPASRAQLALLVLEAEKGLDAQAKRHAVVCSLLGIPRLIVAVNKMDLAGHSQARFEVAREAFERFAARLGFKSVAFTPVSAASGDNVARRGATAMGWHDGPALLEQLENLYIGGDRNLVDLRFCVQSRLTAQGRAWYAGRVESGVLKVGDEVVVLPSHRRTRVRSNMLGERSHPNAKPPH